MSATRSSLGVFKREEGDEKTLTLSDPSWSGSSVGLQAKKRPSKIGLIPFHLFKASIAFQITLNNCLGGSGARSLGGWPGLGVRSGKMLT